MHMFKKNYQNTIIIMTSNVGTQKLKEFSNYPGFATEATKKENVGHAERIITSSINKAFPPEFINRLDDIIIFNQLSD